MYSNMVGRVSLTLRRGRSSCLGIEGDEQVDEAKERDDGAGDHGDPFGRRVGPGLPRAPIALRLGRDLGLVGGLLGEVRAGSVGRVGIDDPGRVLGLGHAGVVLAQEAAQGLGVHADLLGEGLGCECVGHGTPFVVPLSSSGRTRILIDGAANVNSPNVKGR